MTAGIFGLPDAKSFGAGSPDLFGGAAPNPYAPAMQANDAALQRRQMMAQRLMQPAPGAPMGSSVMPLMAGGDAARGGGGPLIDPELQRMLGQTLRDSFNPSPFAGEGVGAASFPAAAATAGNPFSGW